MTERLTDRELARWLECVEGARLDSVEESAGLFMRCRSDLRSQATELIPRLLAEVKERREAERRGAA